MEYFVDIIELFYDASGMEVSLSKSCFYSQNIEGDVMNMIASFLPFKFSSLGNGFRYLGFFLKPSGYRIKNWHWLVEKFEKRINHWTFGLLSIGSRLTLLKAILIGYL